MNKLFVALMMLIFASLTFGCNNRHSTKSEDKAVGAHYYTWFAVWEWDEHDHYVYAYNRYYEEVNEYWQCWYETNTNSMEDGVSIPETNQKFIKVSDINRHFKEVLLPLKPEYKWNQLPERALKAINDEAFNKGQNNSVNWSGTYVDEEDKLARENVVETIGKMIDQMHVFGYTTTESCPTNQQLIDWRVAR